MNSFGALMNGFTAKCYDGKAFFAADHKMGGVTYSNLGTQELCMESYKAARASIMSIRGDKGKEPQAPDLLVGIMQRKRKQEPS